MDAVVITIDGTDLPVALYDRLTLVRVEESVHLPDIFTMRFDDPHFELFDAGTFRPGCVVNIAFRAEGDLVTVTVGEVTAISVEPGPTGRHDLVLSGLDAMHRLAGAPKTRSFLNMSDGDIVDQIADEYALETDITGTGDVHEYVLQTSESDFAFLSRRARRAGYDIWVAEQVLHYVPRPSANSRPPSLTWGDNLQRFKVRFSTSERCDRVTVRGHDPISKRTLVGQADAGDPGTDAPAASEMVDHARQAFGTVERSAGQFPVATQTEADALAASLLRRASGSEVIARGEASGDPLIAAGADVVIDQVGQRLSGTWRLTEVHHIYGGQSPYITRFVSGGAEAAGLADLLGGGSGEAHKTWGSLVIGLVTNCDDPERFGRVKVKYPTLSEEDESAWARVVAPGAGPDRGLQCLPEVGDEVLIGFELDDTTRPLVLGGLWNGQDAPPDPEAVVDGQIARRVWRSRTGHRVELQDDRPSSITLETASGDCRVVLNGDDGLVELTAQRKLTLNAPRIEITASADVTISGTPIKLN